MKLPFSIYMPVIFYFVSVLVLIGMMTYMHENIHQIIYEHDGIESRVEYQILKGKAVTIANLREGECNDLCEQSHEFNEIVGYHSQVILGSIIFGIFFWWFTTEVRRIEDEYS